ncbi:MAG TPA: hypothetical protein VK698_05065 [Kofleriaceae bacterium]|nr:hypothetical protein [Kofleriaceae bacterium]
MAIRSAERSEADNARLAELAAAYTERHAGMESYVLSWRLAFLLLRKLGLDPAGARGRIANLALIAILLFGVPAAVAAATDQWHLAPLRTWAMVALLFGVLGAVIYGPLRAAIEEFLSLHRLMAEVAGLERLVAWDRRWFSLRVSIPATALFATAMFALLIGRMDDAWSPIDNGTLVVAAMLLYEVGEVLFTVVMLGVESRLLDRYDYDLYRLSPIDSIGVQRSIRGSNRLGLLVGLVATTIIVGFLMLFADQAALVGEIALSLLAMAYIATAMGVILPRLAMKRIVRGEKERELGPLQHRLDELTGRLGNLSEREDKELVRLRETHDLIRRSGESVLPLSSIGQLLSSLIIPTLTVALSQAGREFILRLFR